MIEITKVFQNTDEINAYLFKDTTPFAYCKAVVEDMIAEITEYLNGKCDDDGFDSVDFFWDRQCDIYLKNHTVFHWTLETPLAAVCLPNPDDIEYIMIYGTPKRMTWEEAKELGISEEAYRCESRGGLCNLGRFMDERTDCRMDSIHGVFGEDDEYNKTVLNNRFHRGKYRSVARCWPDWQVQLDITDQGFHGTYFANIMDGYIGALIAEQVLLSNKPEHASLQYGTEDYQSMAAFAPVPVESGHDLYEKAFMDEAHFYCSRLDSRLELSADGCCISSDDRRRTVTYAMFVYLYVHSLLHTAPAENFSIIEPIFAKYLSETVRFSWELEEHLKTLKNVCHANYYKKPRFRSVKTPVRSFQAAVWAVVNSDSYLSALKNILEFVQYKHSAKLAVILTGIFAGIYYQHYRIPQEYLTNNRYYGKFSASIIPLDHKVYDRSKQHPL